jgi:threonine dehydratase
MAGIFVRSAMAGNTEITREWIAATEAAIRPYIRRTPLLKSDMADFGLAPGPLTFKLEMLQHSGSFKARGAFANLLLRETPATGVVAASGGNHGVAVSYAAQRLGVPATIFLPDITSPAKVERIRGHGARLIFAGTRYADALAASEVHVAQTGAMPVHAYDQKETLLGQGTVGMEFEQDAPDIDRRAGAVADLACGVRGGRAGRCAGRRHRRRQPGAAPRRRTDVSDCARACRAGGAGQR